MSRLRRFKCRNGSILEECPNPTTICLFGFMADYKVVTSTNGEYFPADSKLALALMENSFPRGCGIGREWDIMEEI